MLIYDRLRLKNFLSFSNEMTEFDLNTSESILITGKNGSGKSVLLDALNYVQFGTPLRKINNDKLINRVNKKSMVVELECTKNSRKYKVIRGLKPVVFQIFEFIDDKWVNQGEYDKRDMQNDLEIKLGLNEKIFKQICILGSDLHIPYMRLALNERRMIIENLFDLDILTGMKEFNKDKIKQINNDLNEIENSKRLCLNTIENLKSELNRIEIQNNKLKTENEKSILEYKNKSDVLKGKIGDIDIKISENSNFDKDEIDKLKVEKENTNVKYRNELLSLETTKNEKIQEVIKQKNSIELEIKDFQNDIKELNNAKSNISSKVNDKYKDELVKISMLIKLIRESILSIDMEIKRKYNSELNDIDIELSIVNTKLNTVLETIEFYDKNDECDRCKQKFNVNKKTEILNKLFIDRDGLNSKIKKLEDEKKKLFVKIDDEIKTTKEDRNNDLEHNLKELENINDTINKDIEIEWLLINDKILEFCDKINDLSRIDFVNDYNQIESEYNNGVKNTHENYSEKLITIDEKLRVSGENYYKVIDLTSERNILESNLKSIEENILSLNKVSYMDTIEIESNLKYKNNDLIDITNKINNKKLQTSYLEILLNVYESSKKYIIERYLPVLNEKIIEFLNLFEVNFLSELKFNNDFMIDIFVNGNEVEFNSFSSGQRLRINLILLFTFMSFSKAKSGLSTNLLVLDEIFDSSLDEKGTEIVFNILKQIALNGSTVYVVSPKIEHHDRFEKIIEMKMENRFTKMVKQ